MTAKLDGSRINGPTKIENYEQRKNVVIEKNIWTIMF
jgi:hypothetical protein